MDTPQKKTFDLKYPRFVFRRKVLNGLIKLLLPLLSRLKVSGLENIPDEGPVILAANHVSTLEPLLVAVYPKRSVEPIGAGDMPFDGITGKLVEPYGFIRVNRGTLDRKGMNQALDVLQQDGVLGIFPEGGTWSPGRMRAQIGVAWLSDKANAPVVPIGFSGFIDSLSLLFKLKRPKLEMKVGKPIPAFSSEDSSLSSRDAYQAYADMVLDHIQELINPNELLLYPVRTEFSLQVLIGSVESQMEEVELKGANALAEAFFTPVIMSTLYKNLKKPIGALLPVDHDRTIPNMLKAIDAVFEVLSEHPGFFTFRMEPEVGRQVEVALHELKSLLEKAERNGQTLVLNASGDYFYSDSRVEHKTHQYVIKP